MDGFKGYERFQNVYEIQLTGSAIFWMNILLLKDECDWNSYPNGTIYLT